jgi:uncharacterized lipoprotein NlpE involved in copper resistance
MKKLIVALVAGFMSLAVAGAYAAEDAKKGDAMKSDTGAAKSDKGAAKSADKAKGADATAKDDDKKKKKDDTKK